MIWNIYKLEMQRITSNWKRSAAVLLLPAALMMVALNVFPMLINYLSTGTFGKTVVYIVEAPDSFSEYLDEIDGRTAFKINSISKRDFESDYQGTDFTKSLKKGSIFVFFDSSEDISFDDEIARYYSNLAQGYEGAVSHATITMAFDGSSFLMETKVDGFSQVVIDGYIASLPDKLAGSDLSTAQSTFTVDEFNPVVKILDHRSEANSRAADVVPGIMILLMYYCVYSLTCDLFAAEKDRGFFNKLLLTPVPGKTIVYGKMLCILTISTASALIAFFFLFLSSWLNTSNDAMSLIPFGMLLTTSQLLMMLLVIVTSAFMMTATTTYVVFSLDKMQDIIINLQLPLALLLMDFFIMMLRGNRPFALELFFPMHNAICMIRDIFWSEDKPWRLLIVVAVNIIWGVKILRRLFQKEIFK